MHSRGKTPLFPSLQSDILPAYFIPLSKSDRCVFVPTLLGPATAAFKVSITTGAAGGQAEVRDRVAFTQQASHSYCEERAGRHFDPFKEWVRFCSFACGFSISDQYRYLMHRNFTAETFFLVKNSRQLCFGGVFTSHQWKLALFALHCSFLLDNHKRVRQIRFPTDGLLHDCKTLHVSDMS